VPSVTGRLGFGSLDVDGSAGEHDGREGEEPGVGCLGSIWATVRSAVVSCKAAGEGDDPFWLAISERTCGVTDAAKSPALTRLERATILLLVALRAAAAATVARAARPIEPPICWPTLSAAEAIPESVSRTPATVVIVIGTKMKPRYEC